jgi:hypothetical protein
MGRRGRSSLLPFRSSAARRQADLFWADLIGVPARASETAFEADEPVETYAPETDLEADEADEAESPYDAGDDTLSAGGAEGEELRSWPTLSTLPDSIVDQIVANRGRVPSRASEIRPSPGGYFAFGKNFTPSTLHSPEEDSNPRLKELITRLNVEVAGEGRTSSVMTGDAAKFTWGRGLAHGGALETWVNDWLASSPQAKDALLDLGITLSGTTWKIVDTAGKVVKSGEEAMALINGREPADSKKLLLSIFMHVAEQFGTEAANAQWKITKKIFYDKLTGPPKDVIDNPGAWSAKAVCDVVHGAMWGKFAGWHRFKRTGGDSKKILRLEVDYTRFYENKGSYILVPPTFGAGGKIAPSGTMLLNMGARYMIDDGIVQPLGSLADAQRGDVVFQMSRSASPRQEFYVLRGVPAMYDPQEEMMDEILAVQGYSMSALLSYFDKVRDKGGRNKGYARLKAMRDYYASSQNPRKEAVGLRPRVAMDAVLHRGEGPDGSGWIVSDCQRANLPSDQVELIKKKVGIP